MIRGKIAAWISIDHEVLPESETKHELGKAVCWIPSKAGAPFRIGYTAHNRGYDLRVSVYIDGELVAEQTHAPRRGRAVTSDGIRGRKDDSGTECPFLFKERSITVAFAIVPDNDMDVISEAKLSQLGSIKVTFAWIIADRASLSTRPCRDFRTTNSHHAPIYEGQVKRQSSAVAHAAGLGARRKISPNRFSAKHRFMRSRQTLRPLRWRETTLRSTTFEFKYAPREHLSAEGILECSLPSSPSLDTPNSRRFATHSPWRSHVGTPYRELWDASFTNFPRVNARELWLGDSELDFNTPVKLGKHTISNYTPVNKSISYTPLTKLGNHTIANSPPARFTPLFKEETGDTSIVEITADEFYRREVIDLTGLDSDDE